jgi:hypothetical protein
MHFLHNNARKITTRCALWVVTVWWIKTTAFKKYLIFLFILPFDEKRRDGANVPCKLLSCMCPGLARCMTIDYCSKMCRKAQRKHGAWAPFKKKEMHQIGRFHAKKNMENQARPQTGGTMHKL